MKINVSILLTSFVVSAVFVTGSIVVLTKILNRNVKDSETSVTFNSAKANPSYNYQNIDSLELKTYLDSGKDVYLLDVHIPEQEHITGTNEFIPFNDLTNYKSKLPKDKNTEIVVYCRSGNMSETASQELINMGYTNVKNLEGGINGWKAQGYSL